MKRKTTPILFCILSVFMPQALADEARIQFVPGVNLVSLPLAPAATWTAHDLMTRTGSPLVARTVSSGSGPARFDTYLEGLGREPFSLEGGRAYLIQASRAGTLVVTGSAWPPSPGASLTRGLNALGLTSPPGRFDSRRLAREAGSSFVARAILGQDGRGRLAASLPDLDGAGFALLEGQGYLLSAPSSRSVTLFEAARDESPPSLRITSPGSGQQGVLGEPVTVVAEASDESGLSRVEFEHAGSRVSATSPPFQVTFSLSGAALQTSTFHVTAIDAAGNVTTRQVDIVALEPVRSSTIRGVIQEAITRAPIPAVTVSIAGSGRTTRTGPEGLFRFEDAPDGDQSLLFDGSTGLGGPYAGYTLDLRVLPGVDNPILRPVFLPRIDSSTFELASTTRTANILSAPAAAAPGLPGIALTVPAGATVDSSGRPFTGNLSLTEVPAEFTPSSLPDGIRPGLVSTLQPAGVLFNRPLPISYPNVDRLPPGFQVDIYQVNHATGRFEVIGRGTVSEEGRMIVSDGAILTSASWHAAAPPPPPQGKLRGSAEDCGCDCPLGVGTSSIDPKNGILIVFIALPSFEVEGETVTPLLTYSSARASGKGPVEVELDYSSSRPPPILNIIRKASDFGPTESYSYANIPPTTSSYAFTLDGSKLPTGAYPVEFEVQGDYQFRDAEGRPVGSLVSSFVRGTVNIRNDADSPFGAGWQLDGLNLIKGPVRGGGSTAKAGSPAAAQETGSGCGEAVLQLGSGRTVRYVPVIQAVAEISRLGERDLYRFPASFGDRVTVQVERLAGTGSGSSSLDPVVEIVTSKGVVMGRDDDSGTAVPEGPGRNARIRELELRATDVYSVAVGGSAGTVGRYRLSVSGVRRSRLVASAPATIFTTLQPAFTFTDAILAGGVERTYPLTAAAGQVVDIRMNRLDPGTATSGLNPRLELRDASGVVLAFDDDTGPSADDLDASGAAPTPTPGGYGDTLLPVLAGPGRNARIAHVTLPTTGTYTIAAQGAASTTGRYRLAIFFGTVPGTIEVADSGPVETRAGFIGPDGDPDVLEDVGATCELTLRKPDGTEEQFSPDGRLVSRSSPAGTSHRYQYSGGLLSRLEFGCPSVAAKTDGSPSAAAGLSALQLAYSGGKIASITDPLGRTTRFTVDAGGDLTNVVFPDGATRSFRYGRDKLLSAAVLEDGAVEEFSFNDLRQVVSVRSGGVERRFTPGLLAAARRPGEAPRQSPSVPTRTRDVVSVLTDARGFDRKFKTEDAGQVTEATDPLGRVTRFQYDDKGRLSRKIRPGGGSYSYGYTSKGSPAFFRDDATGAAWRTEYGPLERPLRTVDPLGNQTQFAYDGAGNLLRRRDALGNVTLYGRDACGRTTSQVDPLGNVTQFEYDDAGNISAVVDPSGLRLAIERDRAGLPVRVSRPGGRVSTSTYTAAGLLSRLTDPLGAVTEHRYDARGRRTQTRRSLGGVSTYEYDSQGRLSLAQDALGNATRFGYDAEGNLVESIDAEGRISRSTYDAAGQLVTRVEPDGARTLFSYDADGRVSRIVAAVGTAAAQTSEYFYDSMDRVVAEVRAKDTAQEVRVTRAYDLAGRLVSIADGRGKVWSFVPDALGRTVRELDPAGRVRRRFYDAAGRMERVVRPSGAEVRFGYDAASRLMRAEYVRKDGQTESVVSLAYDIAGNVTHVSDASSDLTLAYDLADRAVELVDGVSGRVVRYRYDAEGRLLEQSVDGVPQATRQFEYDVAGRLLGIAGVLGPVRYGYDRTGLPATMELPGGAVRQLSYDSNRRLVGHQTRVGPLLVYAESLSYDPLGRLTGRTVGSGTIGYGYDALDRLTRVDYPGGDFEQFAYDASDNRTELTTGGGTTRYQVDDVGQLTRVDRPGGGGVALLAYTADGELDAVLGVDGSVEERYEWDVAGRLRSVALTGGRTESYRYHAPLGPLANLRVQTIEASGRLEQHQWSLDGNLLLDETGPATPTRAYLAGPGLDSVLAVRDVAAQQTFVAVTDFQGSLVGAISASGSFAGPVSYRAFGERLGGGLGPSPRLSYTGREQSPATGLLYLRNRWYSPKLGRFLSEDPIGLAGGLNLYSYVGNNPLRYRDPLGLQAGPIPAALPVLVVLLGQLNRSNPTGSSPLAPFNIPGAAERSGGSLGVYYSDVESGLGPFDRRLLEDELRAALDLLELGGSLSVFVGAARGGTLCNVSAGPGSSGGGSGGIRPPEVGGGANLEALLPEQVKRIQAVANRSGQEITLVGSQATGYRPSSDFDYLVPSDRVYRDSIRRFVRFDMERSFLPVGPPGTGAGGRGIDIFPADRLPLDTSRPYIKFFPQR